MNATTMSAALLAGLGLAAAIMALRLGLWTTGTPGPGFFPFITGLLLFAAGGSAAMQAVEEGRGDTVDRGRLLRYATAIAGFGLLMKPLGTILATAALIAGVLRGIEKRPWGHSLALTLLLSVLSWALFRFLLGVPLPSGLLGIG